LVTFSFLFSVYLAHRGAAIGGVAGGATGFAVGNHIQNEEHGD